MPEHEHEWRKLVPGPVGVDVYCECRHREFLGYDEVIRRLNATEKLGAERAKNAGVWMHLAFDNERDDLAAAMSYQDALLAYAAAREVLDG